MAKYSSKDCGFHLLGGYSMLGSDSKIEDVVELKLGEAYVLGDSDEAYWTSGAKKTTVTQEGYFDDATNGVHEALKDLPVLALPMSIAPHGNTNAAAIDVYQSVQRVGYTKQFAVGDIIKANGEYGIWYGKKRSHIIHALGAETTSTGDNESLDIHPFAGNTSNGGAMVLHVTALSGCATVTIGAYHSTDGGTYTLKQAFTNVAPADVPGGANAGQYVALTSTMNQFWAVHWTFNTPSSPSCTFMVAVYQAP